MLRSTTMGTSHSTLVEKAAPGPTSPASRQRMV
jgi:hypothetical protein